MKVETQSVNFNADQKLIDFIQKRMDKLDLFYDKIIKSTIYLKVENTSDKANKIFEVQLSIPGDIITFKKVFRTFEEGTIIPSAIPGKGCFVIPAFWYPSGASESATSLM